MNPGQKKEETSTKAQNILSSFVEIFSDNEISKATTKFQKQPPKM
jgi:hypothetical protein